MQTLRMRISGAGIIVIAPLLVIAVLASCDYEPSPTDDQESLESAVRTARAENRAAEWATITRTKSLSVDEDFIEIRIPHDRLPGAEVLDRVCYVYKNRALNAVSLVCRP